jgi:hypothetical protein
MYSCAQIRRCSAVTPGFLPPVVRRLALPLAAAPRVGACLADKRRAAPGSALPLLLRKPLLQGPMLCRVVVVLLLLLLLLLNLFHPLLLLLGADSQAPAAAAPALPAAGSTLSTRYSAISTSAAPHVTKKEASTPADEAATATTSTHQAPVLNGKSLLLGHAKQYSSHTSSSSPSSWASAGYP